jgi:hypothetical protein
MATNVNGSRLVLAAAVFVCMATVERNANALAINVPYSFDGKTLTAMSGTAGDATLFNNLFFFSYIAPDGNIAILADSNLGTSGQTVAYSYEIAVPAQYGTAFAVDNGTLYLFFVQSYGNSGYNGLSMISSTDGVHWSTEIFFIPALLGNGVFDTPPAAVVWDGQILVYANEGGSYLEQFNITGTSYSGPYNFGGYNYSTPARSSATVWQGRLSVSFTDASHGNEIGILTFTDAAGWTSETLTGLYGVPSIYPQGSGALNMVYRAPNDHLYGTFSSNGVSFVTPQEDAASTSYRAPVQFSTFTIGQDLVFYIGENNELFTVLEN